MLLHLASHRVMQEDSFMSTETQVPRHSGPDPSFNAGSRAAFPASSTFRLDEPALTPLPPVRASVARFKAIEARIAAYAKGRPQ